MLLPPGIAAAHTGDGDTAPTLATAVTLDPWLALPLAAAALLYARGLRALWRGARAGAGVPVCAATAFGTGIALLAVAFIWPLDALGEWSLAAHMAQHMLLVAGAAPLLVAGRPGPVLLAALPTTWARRAGRAARLVAASGIARRLSGAGFATLLQVIVVWGWHAPVAMQAALRDDAVHYAMHASFVVAGLLFWHAVFSAVRDPRSGIAPAAAALAATMLQMGLLGALLTFGLTSRYPFYADRAVLLGLTPLEDQQLAGLIMWVPGAVPYLLGALVVAGAWLRRSARFDH